MNSRDCIWPALVAVLITSCGREPSAETADAKHWRKALVAAIRENDTQAVGRILATNSLSPDAALNDNGLTPLMVASSAGRISVVRWLLDRGAQVNAGTREENGTALLGACTRGRIEVAKLLIERGANVNHQDEHGWSPLLGAIRTTNTLIAEYLIGRGADINATLSNGRSALILCAAEAGDISLLRLLIEKGAKVNHASENGEHALMEAATVGQAAVIPVLLQNGARIDLQNKDGWTALLKAAAQGYCEAVKALCDADANPAITNKFGRTALNYARGITGTNTIAKVRDITAAVEKGIIDHDENYYVLVRTGSGRDFDCIIEVLEAHEKRFRTSAAPGDAK